MIEIACIGGYNEVGKNMTAVKVDDEVVILDIGLYIPAILGFEEEQNYMSSEELIKIGAIPDDNLIKDWHDNIKSVILGHCHLDHLGGAPYLCEKYNAPIIGTPYTIEVLKRIIKDKGLKSRNKFISIKPGKRFQISKNIKCELINVTHSTLQTVIVVLFTKYGNVIYANDFKLDKSPVLGKETNYERLKDLDNVKVLIMDALYSGTKTKTPSENVAREMLKEILLNDNTKGKAIIVTTFSSHIARLKSIMDFAKKINRKVVLLGRSMGRYFGAADSLNLIEYTKNVELVEYPRQIAKKLKEIEKNGRSKYLIVCTGHQGEPKSVLAKILNKEYSFEFLPEDIVVFSSNIIPNEISIKNRKLMEDKLEGHKVKIFKGIHQSGHLSGEDMIDFIKMIKPEHIIPCQGDKTKLTGLCEIAKEIGYKEGKTVHVLNDGDRLTIK